MSECKYCHEEIEWGKNAEGKPQPKNADGSPHRCQNRTSSRTSPAQPTTSHNDNPTKIVIGRLDNYGEGSATFTLKDGRQHVYALSPDRCHMWQKSQLVCGSVFLKVTLDKNQFVQQADSEPFPEWGYEIPKPGTAPEGFKPASELPKETTALPLPPLPDPFREPESLEDRVRKIIAGMNPSDRVGMRISLAGMVNSVIEMESITNDPQKPYAELEADVKRKALAMFLWCDSMTTQNIKGGQ